MDYFWYSYVFLLGSIVGSFLNVCIFRIPKKESIVTGRSHCPSCGHTLSFLEMIPVFSFLFLRGKCKCCKARISVQYPIVEFLTGFLWLLAVLNHGFTLHAFSLCLFFCILIVVSGIDFATMEIPDSLHICVLLLAVVTLAASQLFSSVSGFAATLPVGDVVSVKEAVIGFLIISLPLLLFSVITNGFGGGDIKLCAVCGLFLGYRLVLLGFFFGCIFAALYGLFLLLSKKASAKTAFSFGPFLSVGFILSALYGERILSAYFSLFL